MAIYLPVRQSDQSRDVHSRDTNLCCGHCSMRQKQRQLQGMPFQSSILLGTRQRIPTEQSLIKNAQ